MKISKMRQELKDRSIGVREDERLYEFGFV